MKLNISSDSLMRAVSVASKGVSSKTQLPVLSNLLLKADKKGLVCIGTDLMISLKSSVGAEVENEGEILVPARVLSDLVMSLPSGTVSIIKDKNILKLEVGGVKVSITGQSADEFPKIGEFGEGGISLPVAEFVNKVMSVAVAAARDGIRPVFEGILCMFSEDRLKMVATDGFRLAVDEITGLKNNEKKKDAVVPAKPLVDWAKLMNVKTGGELKIKLDLKKQIMMLSMDGVEMSIRLVSGEFPDFAQILPDSFKTKVIFSREELESSVRRAVVFARGNANIVYLNIDDNGVVLKAEAAEIGSDVDKLSSKQEGESVKVAFNAKYLLDYLSVVDSSEVIFEINGELKPGIFRVDKSSFLYIVMPIKS